MSLKRGKIIHIVLIAVVAALFAAVLFCAANIDKTASAEETVGISFDYKCVQNTVETTRVPLGSVVELPDPPTRRGYNFAGWVDANGQEYSGLPVYSDKTFYAKWTLNDLWLGYFSEYSQNTVYGDDAVLEIKDLSPEIEYRFVWLKKSGDGTWAEVGSSSDGRLVVHAVSDSGEYRVRITCSDPVSGVVREAASPSATLNVSPRTVSVRAVGTEGLIYDGRAKTVGAELVGLLFGDTASFSIDGNTASDVGIHRARVFNLGNPNYKLAENAGFDYEIKRGDLKFSAKEGLPELELKAKRGFSYGVAAEYSTLSEIPEGVDVKKSSVLGKYAIVLTGYNSSVDGEVAVRIKVGEDVSGKEQLKVVIKTADGSVSEPEFSAENGWIVFSTDADCQIVLAADNALPWWLWLIIALSIAICALCVAAVILAVGKIKRARKKSVADCDTPRDATENCREEGDKNADSGVGNGDSENLSGAESGAPVVDTAVSFNKKIADADGQIKIWYSEIKNDLLSFRDVKSRVSTTCDSFRVSRKLVAKITLIGSTLRLSLALDPDKEKYNDGRFPHKNKGDKPMYKDVPFQVKIKTELGLRRARALIGEMMNEKKIKKDSSYEKIDYAALYESRDENNAPALDNKN